MSAYTDAERRARQVLEAASPARGLAPVSVPSDPPNLVAAASLVTASELRLLADAVHELRALMVESLEPIHDALCHQNVLLEQLAARLAAGSRPPSDLP